MTIEQIREELMINDDFVLAELKKLMTYYQLKHTPRWGQIYTTLDTVESVAEHVYGMHILCDYFLPFYPKLDRLKVQELVTWHDMAEALVGDMTTLSKTKSHKIAELSAETKIVETASTHLQAKLQKIFDTYNAQETNEAMFVKAIDKIEPVFHLYFLSSTTESQPNPDKKTASDEILRRYQAAYKKYLLAFDIFVRLDELLNTQIILTNYIHPEA